MQEGEDGQLSLGLVQSWEVDYFPAYQMCPHCGHNLCNNESLTGVELDYMVEEKKG